MFEAKKCVHLAKYLTIHFLIIEMIKTGASLNPLFMIFIYENSLVITTYIC